MDYANGKIYKIVCNITGEVYIGSSTQPLAKRLSLHKNKKNPCRSKQIIDRGDYVIVLIEAFPCANKSELFQRERYHFDLIPNINRQRPFVTEDERIELHKACLEAYYETNNELILTKKKAYNETNKEVISTQKKAHYEANKDAILIKRRARYQAKKLKDQPSQNKSGIENLNKSDVLMF